MLRNSNWIASFISLDSEYFVVKRMWRTRNFSGFAVRFTHTTHPQLGVRIYLSNQAINKSFDFSKQIALCASFWLTTVSEILTPVLWLGKWFVTLNREVVRMYRNRQVAEYFWIISHRWLFSVSTLKVICSSQKLACVQTPPLHSGFFLRGGGVCTQAIKNDLNHCCVSNIV